MKIRNGFTLIELMIVIAVIAILAAIVIPVFTGKGLSNDAYSGRNVPAYVETSKVEVRCIEGFKVLVTPTQSNQMVDADGKAISCDVEKGL